MLNGDGATLHKAKEVYISSHQIAYEYFIQLDEESWPWGKMGDFLL